MTADVIAELNAEAPASEPRASARAWYVLGLTVVATLFGFVDRQVLVILVEPIKHDLSLSDSQIGLIQGLGPGLLAAAAVVGIGWLTDRAARQIIFALAVLAWSIATAFCGMADSFWELLGASVAIGIGEAALGPVIMSVFPDLFPRKVRIIANLVYFGATLTGAGIGMALAGAAVSLVQAHGQALPFGLGHLAPWRTAFVLAALPGLPLALIIAAIGPIRRIPLTPAAAAHASLGAYFRAHWRALVGLCGCSCAYGAGLSAFAVWTPVYAMRVLKASPAAVGAGFGVALIAGSLAGVVSAGVLARLLTPRLGVMAPILILRAAMAAVLLPALGLLFADRPIEVYVLFGLVAGIIMAGAGLLPTAIQDLAPATLRGQISSILTLVALAAPGLGPIAVGLASDRAPAGSHGLLWAIVGVAAVGLLIANAALWLADKAFRRTLAEFASSGG
jgi:MFS family permease